MLDQTKHIARVVACSIAFSASGLRQGQVQRSSLSVVGQTVPERRVGTGTVLLRTKSDVVNDALPATSSLDTLELRLLEIEIREREAKVQQTSFFVRLLPQIHFSASYGIRDLMFVDPASFTPYILP